MCSVKLLETNVLILANLIHQPAFSQLDRLRLNPFTLRGGLYSGVEYLKTLALLTKELKNYNYILIYTAVCHKTYVLSCNKGAKDEHDFLHTDYL